MAIPRLRIPRAAPALPDRGFKAEAIQTLLPQGAGGWALEVGPDLLGAAAATAYAGPVAGIEDAVLGLGGSAIGRMAGSALAYNMARLGKSSPTAMRAMVQQGAGIGGMAGGMGAAMFGPRPFTDAIRQQQQEDLLAQQQIRDNWLLSQAAASPAIQNYDALLSQFGVGA